MSYYCENCEERGEAADTKIERLSRAMKMVSRAVGDPEELETTQRTIEEGLVSELIGQRDAAIAALTMMYDKWEGGDDCYEEPDTFSGFIGRAFCLTEKEEDRVIAIIGKEPSGIASLEPTETDELHAEILALREQVAALESREVCTVAHDNVETCGYCQRDSLRKDAARLDWIDAQWTAPIHVEMSSRSHMGDGYRQECIVYLPNGQAIGPTVRVAIDVAREMKP